MGGQHDQIDLMLRRVVGHRFGDIAASDDLASDVEFAAQQLSLLV